jgi:hypothetical protein
MVLNAADAGRVLNEAVSAASSGDFGPLKQLGEVIGRGLAPFVSAAAHPQTAPQSFILESEAQAAPLSELTRQRQQRIEQIPELYSSQVVDEETRARLAARAALDPSIAGKITRGGSEFVTEALPGVLTGIATGGSVPAIATVVGLQSLNRPENLPFNVALAATPLPIGKALAPLIRRLRGIKPGEIAPAIESAAVRAPEVASSAPAVGSETGLANLGGAAQAISANLRQMLRDSVARTGKLPAVERGSAIDRAFEGLVTGGAPRDVTTLNTALLSMERGATPAAAPAVARTAAENPFSALETPPALSGQRAGLTTGQEEAEALNSAIQKLGTDNPGEIADMIANANRRFNETVTKPGEAKRPITSAERQSAIEDYNRIKTLTNAEHDALAEVLPERTLSPVNKMLVAGEPTARAISDIPASEPNAQLDANLRELEAFFGAQKSGTAARTPDVALPAGPPVAEFKGVPLNELEVSASQGVKVADARGPAVQQDYAAKAGTLVAPAEKSSIWDTLVSIWKAGLLTKPTTHLRNIGGTGLFQLSEQAARIPASIADIVRAASTGRRTVAGPNLASLFRGEAAKKGITDAIQVLRKGLTAEQAAKTQAVRQLASGNKVIDAYVNGTFRLLGAEDQFVRSMALRSALEERAKVQVLNEIRQGVTSAGDRAVRISQLIKNPDNALAAQAAADAEIAVFTNDNMISTALGKARQSLAEAGKGGRIAKAGLDVVLPFDKTPTNIIARMIDYSPVGLTRGTLGIARGIAGKAFTPAEERAFAQLFGRGAIGTGLIALGWKLGEAGLMTGMFEDEPGKSARDVAAGRPSGALRIGNSWHQVTGFAPVGNLMALGASLNREFEQSREPEGKQLPEAIGGVLQKTAMEQPLLQAAQSLTQPGNITERAGRLAASVVPGAVADIAGLVDTERRQTKGEGFLGQIESRIPGVSRMLPPAVDALGRPLEDRFSRFIDPTLTSTAKELREPLIQELIRLDVGLPKMQRKPEESADAYLTRVRRFGELYQDYGLQLLGNDRFQSLADPVKVKAFDALSRHAEAQVSEEFETRRKGPAKSPNFRLNPNAVIQSALKAK